MHCSTKNCTQRSLLTALRSSCSAEPEPDTVLFWQYRPLAYLAGSCSYWLASQGREKNKNLSSIRADPKRLTSTSALVQNVEHLFLFCLQTSRCRCLLFNIQSLYCAEWFSGSSVDVYASLHRSGTSQWPHRDSEIAVIIPWLLFGCGWGKFLNVINHRWHKKKMLIKCRKISR